MRNDADGVGGDGDGGDGDEGGGDELRRTGREMGRLGLGVRTCSKEFPSHVVWAVRFLPLRCLD